MRRRSATTAQATAISSIRRRAGSSAACAFWIMWNDPLGGCAQRVRSIGMAPARPAALRQEGAEPADASFAHEVVAGLNARPKRIPAKYFYDGRGAQLFQAITATPEYYLTRCELSILRERADEIAALFPEKSALVELGSGSSEKARILLSAA